MLDLNTLKKVPLLDGLSDAQLAFLQPLFKQLKVPEGRYIIKENTFGEEIYLLVEGNVKVTKDLVKGFEAHQESTEKVLASLRGEKLPTFGETGVLGHGSRTANILTTSDCVLYTLNKTDFESFAKQNYEAAYIVMTNIAKRLSLNLKFTDENLVKLATALYIAVQQ